MAKYCDVIKKELHLTVVEAVRKVGGGCSGENWVFSTNIGNIFTKICDDDNADNLLHGEFASLQALGYVNAVHVPKAIKVISSRTSTLLVTTYLQFSTLKKFQGELGGKLAKLHMNNINLLFENPDTAIKKFGFNVNVCCGKIPIDNSWNENWVDFYINQRLEPQVNMITKKILELWQCLKPKVPKLFDWISVLPSLLHGDLWCGNAGETEREPVIFDPASFYGHHEFDLAITRMFGGFSNDFYREYHRLIPREKGFEERKHLYELFHYLNHWNHFGGGYESQSLRTIRRLLKIIK